MFRRYIHFAPYFAPWDHSALQSPPGVDCERASGSALPSHGRGQGEDRVGAGNEGGERATVGRSRVGVRFEQDERRRRAEMLERAQCCITVLLD